LRASERSDFFASASARSDALIAIRLLSIGCFDCFDGSYRPRTARKAGVVAAPGERTLQARQRAERSGGTTENRQKPPKIAFDFGRSEAGSDA
jgi:hypothetical protein